MNERLDPLPLDIDSLVKSERQLDPGIPRDVEARLLSRLEVSLGIPLVAAAASSGAIALKAAHSGGLSAVKGGAATTAGVSTKTATTFFASKLGIAAAAFIAGGGTGVVLHSVVRTPQPQPKIVYVQAAPVLPVKEPEPAPLPEPVVVEQQAAPPPLAKRPVVAPPATSAAPSLLAAERALLEVARTALSRGQPEAALAALDRHLKAHPQGQLSEEREALAVQALIGTGRYEDARLRAQRFFQRFPSSLLRPAVDAALKQIP